MSDEPLVLGIETSCDETGVGIVRGHTLLADAVASSVEEHARFGGVVPEVASRAHLEAMVPTLERACETAGIRLYDVDAIAVTSGPGLAGALLVGVAAAKALALALGKPIYGVNHLAAHVAVDQLEHGPLPEPCLAMLVSGGHSSLLRVADVTGHGGGIAPLGATIDDAAGEAFDKVARLLGLPFPGGPHIDRAAREGHVTIDFPRGLTSRRDLERHRFDFSFSGLKTAVARWVETQQRDGVTIDVGDVAASFQEAVCDVLVRKALDAATDQGIEDILIGGGVAANSRLRAMATERAEAEGHPGPGPATRPVHRQRRDGRRARRRAGRPRPPAVRARPSGRLVPAGDRGRGLSQSPRAGPPGRQHVRVRPSRRPRRAGRRTPSSRRRRSARSPTARPGRPAPARGWRPPTGPPGRRPAPSRCECRLEEHLARQVVHRDHAVAEPVVVRRVGQHERAVGGEGDQGVLAGREALELPAAEQLRAGAGVGDLAGSRWTGRPRLLSAR